MRRTYPEHEREARAEGRPALGSGMVFPVAWSAIAVDPFAIPDHWARVTGMDFGWDHPTAGAFLAHDRDSDIIYLYDVHKARQQVPAIHAQAIRRHGDWIPVAWPPDGEQRDKGTGIALAQQYRDLGVNMLPEYATHPPTEIPGETNVSRTSVEAGLTAMLQRMQVGGFKVFSHLSDFKEEFSTYHRLNGKVVKLGDDVISATRYGCMMLRCAITKPAPVKRIDRSGHDWRT
jgi:hypothetical protein